MFFGMCCVLSGRLRTGFSCPREVEAFSRGETLFVGATSLFFWQSEYDYRSLYIMFSWVEKNIRSSRTIQSHMAP